MCCRLNYSRRFAGIIAGLYIFLATFLVGFFAVKLTSRVLWLDISGTELSGLLNKVEAPDTPGPKANVDGPLAIEYIETEPAPNHYELLFKVTNFGSETVRFSRDRKTCGLYQGVGPGPDSNIYITGAVPCAFDTEKLEPFQTSTLRATSYSDYSHYWLSVRYFVGSEEKERKIDLFVTEPHKPKS